MSRPDARDLTYSFRLAIDDGEVNGYLVDVYDWNAASSRRWCGDLDLAGGRRARLLEHTLRWYTPAAQVGAIRSAVLGTRATG